MRQTSFSKAGWETSTSGTPAESSWFMVGPGHPRAVFRAPADPGGRAAWRRWLKGAVATIACPSLLGIVLAANSSVGSHEATAQMERLARNLATARVIAPETAAEIDRLMIQRAYDCSQVTCSAELRRRNTAARDQLRALTTKRVPSEERRIANPGEPSASGVISTSSIKRPVHQ